MLDVLENCCQNELLKNKYLLKFKNLFKSISSQVVKEKRIEKLIQQNSKKKYFILTSQLRIGFLILLKYLKKNSQKKRNNFSTV